MRINRTFPLSLAMALAALPQVALAQERGEQGGEEADEGVRTSHTEVVPYIEAAQVVTAQLSPGDDVLTYTQLAAGVDTTIAGRNSAASASVRYEHTIGYGNASDVDTLSGIARASLAFAGRGMTIEAGGLASRTRVEGNGFSSIGGFGGNAANTSQIYSVYAGPSIQSRSGPVEISSSYRLGYTRVESPDAFVLAPGTDPVDIFDDSVTHNAAVRFGVAPNTVAPVGLGVGAGWKRA